MLDGLESQIAFHDAQQIAQVLSRFAVSPPCRLERGDRRALPGNMLLQSAFAPFVDGKPGFEHVMTHAWSNRRRWAGSARARPYRRSPSEQTNEPACPGLTLAMIA
jgi:hypothetical protein